MTPKIIATIFLTVLCSLGLINMVEIFKWEWETYKTVNFKQILWTLAILSFMVMGVYAIWFYMPV